MSYSQMQKVLTVQEVAEFLKLSVLTIYKYIKEGQIDAIDLGGHYRIEEMSLKRFIENHIMRIEEGEDE